MFLTDAAVRMKANPSVVSAKKGVNTTLECRGTDLLEPDSHVVWKFKGDEIKEDTNKKSITNYETGIFSLRIVNVLKNDSGEYTCIAKVNGENGSEAFIELLLNKSGEFHLLLFLLHRLL